MSADSAIGLREITDEERTRRREELVDICFEFCLLALELWCQKSNLERVDDATVFATAYSMNSTLHKPHVSMWRMGLDEDETMFDGVLPHAMLVPAFRVCGDSDGNNLKRGKIVSRSVVLIYDETSLDKDEQPPSASPKELSQTPEQWPASSGNFDGHHVKRRKLSSEEASIQGD